MNRYVALFRIPNVWVLVLTCFPARVAYGMVSLSIFFKVEQSTGSISSAGLALGLNAASGALTAGIRGSVMDKYGQKWPLRIMVPTYATLTIALNLADAKATMLTLAFVMGLSAPPINLSVRPLWKDIVPPTYLRTAYAFDSAMMSSTTVIGPVLVTALALSTRPYLALNAVAALLFIGGLSLALTPVSRNWIPEKKDKGQDVLLKNRAIQLLMFEGCFIGFGWGVFDVSIPAFAIQENVPHRVAWIFAAFGLANVIGGLLGGLVSKKLAPLSALRRAYFLWSIACIPIAFTYPDWTMALVGASIGFLGGAVQVFYFEVLEAVRPKGSQVSSLGWIWSVEGMFIALGAAVGGIVSEHLSPRIGLGLLPFMIFIGFIILTIGMGRLSTANHIPTEAEDLAAIENLSDPNK